ncbi:MAG: S46 family peptidase, partial [Bacteroidaceae bacterium]
MNKLKIYLLALVTLIVCSAKADEGMWLLQMMQEQHSIDMMKKQGLKLNAADLYNPNGVSLKDAVGIFGRGCTGEIISAEGLVLTNHHCGYGSIQQHSSVEHDYLTDGFWATSRDKELVTPGLTFTFIERIEDVTDIVNAKIASKEITETQSFTGKFLNSLAQELYEKSDLKGKKGIVPQALPFYAGNRFYMFYKKVYSDLRMVAAPPSSVGKFGGETDNWMWPRHTGDFSMFRIY